MSFPMTMVRPQDVLATLYVAGRDLSFVVQLSALERFGPLRIHLDDVTYALFTIKEVAPAKKDPAVERRVRRIPKFKDLELESLWVAYGNDLKSKPLLCLVSIAPVVRVFYLWR